MSKFLFLLFLKNCQVYFCFAVHRGISKRENLLSKNQLHLFWEFFIRRYYDNNYFSQKEYPLMKKIFTTAALGLVALTSPLPSAEQCDCVTYDWLATASKNTSYTDHIFHFRHLFNSMKVRGFLECGTGLSTKYFMDNAKKVTSIEFMTPSTGDFLYKESVRLFKACPNWSNLTYNADLKDECFNNACSYHYATHKDYALIDSKYIGNLETFIKNQIETARQEGNEIDVAFVDPVVALRGDMVNILLDNKVPVVVAHDTANDINGEMNEGLYEWFKVKVPADYEKVYISWGQGTTFWISKSLPEVIASMQKYRDSLMDRSTKGCLKIEEVKDIADQK